jgi:hypothetical protein
MYCYSNYQWLNKLASFRAAAVLVSSMLCNDIVMATLDQFCLVGKRTNDGKIDWDLREEWKHNCAYKNMIIKQIVIKITTEKILEEYGLINHLTEILDHVQLIGHAYKKKVSSQSDLAAMAAPNQLASMNNNRKTILPL